MSTLPLPVQRARQVALGAALSLAGLGMVVGLGTGSTAEHFVELLAKQAWDGLQVTCVSTSIRASTMRITARACGAT